MVTSQAKTVGAYLAGQPPERAAALGQLRTLIRDAVPSAEETMKYRMPTYQLGTGVLCAMASQKQYMSLYVEVEILDTYRKELEYLNLGKSCIRFRALDDAPPDVIRLILQNTASRLSSNQPDR